jgi:hypothetical protein
MAKSVEAPKTITLADSLTNDERKYVHDVVANTVATIEQQRNLPTPRAVHVVPEYEDRAVKTYDPFRAMIGSGFEAILPAPDGKDEQGDYWHLSKTVQTNRPYTCPDCGQDLIGGDGAAFDYLLCPAVPKGKPMPVGVPCDAGCVAACNRGAK